MIKKKVHTVPSCFGKVGRFLRVLPSLPSGLFRQVFQGHKFCECVIYALPVTCPNLIMLKTFGKEADVDISRP